MIGYVREATLNVTADSTAIWSVYIQKFLLRINCSIRQFLDAFKVYKLLAVVMFLGLQISVCEHT